MTDRSAPPPGTGASAVRAPAAAAPEIRGVDLFCGVGGLTHGLALGGIRVLAGVDIDTACRYAYETNNEAEFVTRSVRDLSGDELTAMYGAGSTPRLLAGCAPCQPFSTYGRRHRTTRNDPKWELVRDFGRLVRAARPELVTMENVPQLLDHSVFSEFLDDLDGYSWWADIVDCTAYGVPQTRKRLVLVASRLGPVSLMPPAPDAAERATVRTAIAHLPRLAAGEQDATDPLHVACGLSELNLRRIRASKPGGTWRDWDLALRAKCHVEDSGATYPSVYGRMEWDQPAPTMTTQCFGYGSGRFGHPEQDRAISLREAATLQTFPDDYAFVPAGEPVRFSVLGRLIGNAVPVRVGEVVAQSLLAHVRGHAANTVTCGAEPPVPSGRAAPDARYARPRRRRRG